MVIRLIIQYKKFGFIFVRKFGFLKQVKFFIFIAELYVSQRRYIIKQELPVNRQIREKEVQVISENGEKIGVLPIEEAIAKKMAGTVRLRTTVSVGRKL